MKVLEKSKTPGLFLWPLHQRGPSFLQGAVPWLCIHLNGWLSVALSQQLSLENFSLFMSFYKKTQPYSYLCKMNKYH